MTPARARVIAAAEGGLSITKRELAAGGGVSVGVIDGLIDEGTLETLALPPEPIAERARPGLCAPVALATAPAAMPRRVAHALRARRRRLASTLLEGVTGSGKTEVYFEAVAEALRQGRQALILMPEIALTAQFLDRFAARFGVAPGRLALRHRRAPARAALRGHCRGRGARSWPAPARRCSCPIAELGLIVVDEEHEAAYKQEDGVHYHARDMAVVRGRIEGCPVVLASATPSIETPRQRRARALQARRAAGALRRPPPAADPRGRPAGATRSPRGRWLSADAAPGGRRRRSRAASRRCCSSTAAATRR